MIKMKEFETSFTFNEWEKYKPAIYEHVNQKNKESEVIYILFESFIYTCHAFIYRLLDVEENLDNTSELETKDTVIVYSLKL